MTYIKITTNNYWRMTHVAKEDGLWMYMAKKWSWYKLRGKLNREIKKVKY